MAILDPPQGQPAVGAKGTVCSPSCIHLSCLLFVFTCILLTSSNLFPASLPSQSGLICPCRQYTHADENEYKTGCYVLQVRWRRGLPRFSAITAAGLPHEDPPRTTIHGPGEGDGHLKISGGGLREDQRLLVRLLNRGRPGGVGSNFLGLDGGLCERVQAPVRFF